MKNWLSRLFDGPEIPNDEPPIKPVHRDAVEMRLQEWCKTESLVEASRVLANNQTYKLQLDVLRSEHPCHSVMQFGVSPNDRLVMQARIEGYEMCLNNLDAFKTSLKLPERLEASFEPPQQEKPTRK